VTSWDDPQNVGLFTVQPLDLADNPKEPHCYMNFAAFSEDLLVSSKAWVCPTVRWWDTTIYLVFAVFTSWPTSLLASSRTCVILFIVFIFSHSILISSAWTRSWCILFSSSCS
jgi:hypothetical protein